MSKKRTARRLLRRVVPLALCGVGLVLYWGGISYDRVGRPPI